MVQCSSLLDIWFTPCICLPQLIRYILGVRNLSDYNYSCTASENVKVMTDLLITKKILRCFLIQLPQRKGKESDSSFRWNCFICIRANTEMFLKWLIIICNDYEFASGYIKIGTMVFPKVSHFLSRWSSIYNHPCIWIWENHMFIIQKNIPKWVTANIMSSTGSLDTEWTVIIYFPSLTQVCRSEISKIINTIIFYKIMMYQKTCIHFVVVIVYIIYDLDWDSELPHSFRKHAGSWPRLGLGIWIGLV